MKKACGATGAIIVAAGKGTRMGLGYNKILAKLLDVPVIEWTIRGFAHSGLIDFMTVVVGREDREEIDKICHPYRQYFPIQIAYGGVNRQDSVYSGLLSLPPEADTILIHDGARPFIDKAIIERSIKYAREYGAACAGMPVKDTVKAVDHEGFISGTPDRKSLWNAQTPQSFLRDVIFKSFEKAISESVVATDDAGLAENAGYRVAMFEGSYRNIKITSQEDMILANELIKEMQF